MNAKLAEGGSWQDLGIVVERGSSPSLCGDTNGRFHMVWDYRGAVYYKPYYDGWAQGMRINPGGSGSRAFVSAGSDGRLAVVWTDNRDDTTRVKIRCWEGDVTVTGVDVGTMHPAQLGIQYVAPNPFRASAAIRFGLPSASAAKVSVFDVEGRLIWEKNLDDLAPGYHSVSWGGQNTSGLNVSPGVYFIRLDAESGSVGSKAVLLR